MTFKRDDRISIFGTLRPRPGQSVTKAVVTTYSLDLVAMLGLVLALGGEADAEYEASPLGLVQAFERMRGRLLVMHQLGRIIAPSAHRSILPLLDTMVRAIPSNERTASWHPKTALVRYEADKDTEWRFWIGSRNLTGSTDRDAGLLLVSTRGQASEPDSKIADLAEDLLREAVLTAAEITELRSVRWRAPHGVALRKLLWRRHGQTRSFLADPLIVGADRGCALSPFIDRDGLEEVLKAGSKKVTLMTTERAGSGCAPYQGVTFRTDTPPDPAAPVSIELQQSEAEGEFIEPPSTGIHAKLLAVSEGRRTTLMLGSANLTGRGLVGPNAEAVAILDVTDPELAKTLYDFVEGGLELQIAAPDKDLEKMERAERELDKQISRFLELPLSLQYVREGLYLVIGDESDEILAETRFEASPFLEPDACTHLKPGVRAFRLLKSPPPLSEQTSLVTFRAQSATTPVVSRTWVQSVEMEGVEEDRRDRAILARYVGPSRFRDWLRSLLDGVDGTGGRRWTDKLPATRDPGRLPEFFTLETMLAAWARDHKAFEGRVAGMMAMLDSFEETFDTLPDEAEREAALADLSEVRPFLQAINDAIGGVR